MCVHAMQSITKMSQFFQWLQPASAFFSTMFTCFYKIICAAEFHELNQQNKELMVFDRPKKQKEHIHEVS
jgi:hypothetical protein